MNPLPLLAALFSQYLTQTAPDPDPDTGALSVKALAAENFARVQEEIKDREEIWSAPFVIADTRKGEVTVWGQHAGMALGEPLEFFVITEQSGHDYEALMISFAKPSDLHQALEKIGAKPGGSVSPNEHRFWPRGSRIVAEIEWQPEAAEAPLRMPVEKTALARGEEMKPTPWVFTGAPTLPNPENPEESVYAPDLFSPNSIASTFNLTNTVLDLPFQGSKSQTYGVYIRNPAIDAPTAQPKLLHLRLAREEYAEKELDLTLRMSGPDAALKVSGLENDGFTGLDDLGAVLNRRKGEIHYLQPDFGPDLRLDQFTSLSRELQLLENHLESVRIEPPLPGQLYYKAFVPDPRYRSRENRPSQPIELHFRKSGGEDWNVTLMELEEIWDPNKPTVVLEERIPLANPEAFESYLQDPQKRKPVLFVYAEKSLTHRELQAWLGSTTHRFPIVYVYLIEDEG
ncbi:MAG: YdjY domain-containing protein [Kiritimatiellia bacterium]